MNSNTHPIELLIVALLDMIEGIAWIINELTGGHTTTNQQTTATASATIAINQPTIDQIVDAYEQQQLADYEAEMNQEPPSNGLYSFNGLDVPVAPYSNALQSVNPDWIAYVKQLTVKQLRELTEITNSRYRKADLIQAAITF